MKMLKIEPMLASANARSKGLLLTPGTTLAALVLKGAKPGGQALLSVAGGQLPVSTQQTLHNGQALTLKVTKIGQQVQLQVHDPDKIERQQVQRSQTRALLNMLGQLTTSVNPSTQRSAAATPVPESLTSLLARPESLTRPEQLRNYISALASTPPSNPTAATNVASAQSTQATLGSVLLRAAQIIRSTQTEQRPDTLKSGDKSWERAAASVLRSLTSSAMAQNTPAQNSQQTQQREPHWILALPVQVDHKFSEVQLAIRGEDETTQEQTQRHWQIDVAFDLFDLGPIHAAVRLKQQNLTLDLFAEADQTQQALQSHQTHLRQSMHNAGLTLAGFNVYPGPPPANIQQRLNPGPQQSMNVLSEQA